MKFKIKAVFLLSMFVLLCCSCGNSDEAAMGRYVEEEVTFSGSQGNFISLVQEQPAVGAPDGSRIFAEYLDGIQTWKLITADSREILLEDLSKDGYPYLYYGAGFFYMCRGYDISLRKHQEIKRSLVL